MKAAFSVAYSAPFFSSFFAGQEADESAQLHPGVTCDICEKSVVGIRFKCVVCPNFDLCSTCEAKGLHNDHEMLRITTPRAHNPWDEWTRSFFSQHHHPPHHPPQHPPHHPPHPFGPHSDHGMGPWGQAWVWGRGRGCHTRGGQRGGLGPMRGRGGCGGPRGRCGREDKAKCQRHTEKQAEGDVPVGPPFLHTLGENIASFLAPLGVEVHTYADTDSGTVQALDVFYSLTF